MGRIGSVLGSMAGGWMMAAGLGMPTLFLIVGIPCLIAGITMFTMAKVGRVQLVDAH